VNRCNASFDLQAYLDGELPDEERYRLERHADQCVSCAMELALYRRVFASLDSMPLLDPGSDLTERVLEKVLPSRVRRRWMQVISWSYAATFAAFLAAALVWIAQPGTRAMLGSVSGGVSIRLTGMLVFLLEAVALSAHVLAGAWGFASLALGWFAPLGRAFAPWLRQPSVLAAFAAAALAATGVLVWMRARESNGERKTKHVSILGI